MAADRGAESEAVRAELDQWVHHLDDTIQRLYAEIDRIRRGDVKPLASPGAGSNGGREGGDAADH